MTHSNTNPQSVKCLMHSQQLSHVLSEAGALIKGCFAPVLAVEGRLHRALSPISARQLCHADETYKAETAVHGCHYLLGEMVVRLPDHGLVFECVTCFYCFKRSYLCYRLCHVSIPVKNRTTHPYG